MQLEMFLFSAELRNEQEECERCISIQSGRHFTFCITNITITVKTAQGKCPGVIQCGK